MSDIRTVDELLRDFQNIMEDVGFSKELDDLYRKLEIESGFSKKLCNSMNCHISNRMNLEGEMRLVSIESWDNIREYVSEAELSTYVESVQFNGVNYNFKFYFPNGIVFKTKSDQDFFKLFFEKFGLQSIGFKGNVEESQCVYFYFEVDFTGELKSKAVIVSASFSPQ